jgi:hypothetical protein
MPRFTKTNNPAHAHSDQVAASGNKKRVKHKRGFEQRAKKKAKTETDSQYVESLLGRIQSLERELNQRVKLETKHTKSGKLILREYNERGQETKSTDDDTDDDTTTTSTTSTTTTLGQSVLSLAKSKTMTFIAGLPEVQTPQQLEDVIKYIADKTLAVVATETANVDKAYMDCISDLLASMKVGNTSNKGSLTKEQTIIREVLFTVGAKATMVNGIKKIDVARRLDKNMHDSSIYRFNKRIGCRIEMFSKLKTNAKSSLADIAARCTRSDKIPLALPDTWWHEEGCRVDTNGREPIWVREKDTEKTVRHVRHYYIEGIKDGYEEFLEWEPYKEYLKNGGRKIKEHMFAKGRCKCMRNRDFRSCVNMIEVQMKNLLEAHVELTKKKKICDRLERNVTVWHVKRKFTNKCRPVI